MHNLQLLFINLHYWALNSTIRFFCKILFVKNIPPAKINRIAILRNGSLGDTVCALPAFSLIHQTFPTAEYLVLTNAGSPNNVSLSALIDPEVFPNIVDYYGMGPSALGKKIKVFHPDLFIDLTQYDASLFAHLKTIFFVYALGIKYAFGWQMDQTYFFSKVQEKHRAFENERDRLTSIIKKNLVVNAQSYYIIPHNPVILEHVSSKILGQEGEFAKHKTIGIVIGSKFHRNKWPMDYWRVVVKHFSNLGYVIWAFGGNQDSHDASLLLADLKNAKNWCGQFTPIETAEAIKNCALVITHDTGPMHLTYMVNTPVIGLFSSRNFPGKWDPPQKVQNTVFRTPNMPCAICFHKSCDDNSCMKQILPERVIKAAHKTLDLCVE